MSSGSILPTFGAAPPNIRRVSIPRELQPDLPDAARSLREKPKPPEQPASATPQDDQQSSGRPLSLAGATALSAQEIRVAEPPRAGPPSASSQRIEQAIEQAAAADADVNAAGLTDEEQAYVRELQAIDREVRAHEAAHAATGGAYAGRPTYEYVTGPDGIRYAVSGQVQIDSGTVAGDPEATIQKLETVRRSALAPAKPSGQDRAVAAQAEAGIRAAQAELNAKRTEEADARLSETTGEGSQNPSVRDEGFSSPSISEQISEAASGADEAQGSALSTSDSLIAQTAFASALPLENAQPQKAGLDLLA